MAQFLKQSTAFTFRIGPFVDSTDGVTAETALTIGQADIQISKAGGAFAQTSASPTTTHDADGWYQCPLTSTDTGTLGTLTVQVVMAGALPVWKDFMVLPANVYDSLVAGSDVLNADVTQFGGTNGTFSSGRPEVNASHVAGTALSGNGPFPYFGIVDMGTAQSYDGATDKLKLRAGFSSPDIVGCTVWIYSSTNGLHIRAMVTAWDNTAKDATIDTPVEDPTGTILYVLGASPKASTTLPPAVNVTQIGGDAQSATDLKDFADAGYDPATNKVQGVVTVDTATAVTTVNGLAANVITATSIAADAITAAKVADGTIDAATFAAGAITASAIAADAIGASELAADAVTEIVTGVLTSAMTEAYPTDGSTMTVAQALYLIAQSIGEFSVSGTTVTVKKVDGTTTAATYTLDSSTAPTSRTRAT